MRLRSSVFVCVYGEWGWGYITEETCASTRLWIDRYVAPLVTRRVTTVSWMEGMRRRWRRLLLGLPTERANLSCEHSLSTGLGTSQLLYPSHIVKLWARLLS